MTELRITATDASTVITGAANIHRFDAPTSREIAGTVRSVLGPEPHGAPVHIAADPQRLRELTHALADYDIDPSAQRLAAKVDHVRSIVRAYADTPSTNSREIASVDDLFDEQSGLPR